MNWENFDSKNEEQQDQQEEVNSEKEDMEQEGGMERQEDQEERQERLQERLNEINEKIEEYEGPKTNKEVKEETRMEDPGREEEVENLANEGASEETIEKIRQNLGSEQEEKYEELMKKKEYFQALNRERELTGIDEELEQFSDIAQELDKRVEEGSRWKAEEKFGDQEEFREFREIRQEKFKLETLNEFAQDFPGTEYYLFSESGTEKDPSQDKEMNMVIIEPDPSEDPERKFREEVFKKFLAMSDNNQIGLGEKFTAHSDRDFAYFNVVFAHKNPEAGEEYESFIPTSKDESMGGRNQFDLDPRLNEKGTYEEISWNDEGLPSGPENFYLDVLYNGKYLEDDDEFEQKLDVYTLKEEGLSELQQRAIDQGRLKQEEMLSQEQAEKLREKRREILDSFDQMEKNFVSEEGKVNEEKVPDIEGVDQEEVQETFKRFVDNFLYLYNGEDWEKRDKMFAYPDQPQSNLEVMELVNSPEVIETAKELKQKNDALDETQLRRQVAEFAKSMIAESKNKDKEDYWGEFGEVTDDMFVR